MWARTRGVNWIDVKTRSYKTCHACSSRCASQEIGCGRDGGTRVGIRCLKGGRKGWREPTECRRSRKHGNIHGSERKKGMEGEMGNTATYPHRPSDPLCIMAGLLKRITTIWSLVIVVAERVKRSRREDVDRGQLKLQMGHR